MAVTDFFLDGTAAAAYPSLTTIQPASGTIYSFKRGKITTAYTNVNGYFQIQHAGGMPYIISGDAYSTLGGSSTTRSANSQLNYLVFSEAGVTGGYYVQGPAATSAGATPFSAISNTNTVGIYAYSGYNVYYTLVGVSLT